MPKSGFDAVKGALANDNYRYYAAGNVLSHFGTSMSPHSESYYNSLA